MFQQQTLCTFERIVIGKVFLTEYSVIRLGRRGKLRITFDIISDIYGRKVTDRAKLFVAYS
jgi:hypothetical protein